MIELSFAPHGAATLESAQVHSAVGDSTMYFAPINTHLVAWFERRGDDVLAWLENGCSIRVPGVKSYQGTLALKIDGQVRASYDLIVPARTRVPFWPQRISGGEAPLVAREVATPLVPKYAGPVTEALLSALPQTYTPQMLGGYPGSMGMAGYHPSIGLLPEWDVCYLTTKDPRALRSVVLHALAAGHYGTHYRDELTNDHLLFSAYPYLSVDASSRGDAPVAATGAPPRSFAASHHPDIAFVAYMATGWRYFADEVRFVSTYLYLAHTDHVRKFEKFVIQSTAGAVTTRGAAWSFRTLLHAAIVSGGGQYATALQNNVDFYHGQYVARPNNPQGLVAPYGDYFGGDNRYDSAIWMDDFLTAALGYMLAVYPELPRLRELFDWKARSIVGRLGDPANGYDYRDAAAYTLPYAPSAVVDWTGPGPWYPSWTEIHRAQFGQQSPIPGTALRGTGSAAPDGATGYWANLVPAASYAAEHKSAGAVQAWERLTGASNWHNIANAFPTTPVWGVIPASPPNQPDGEPMTSITVVINEPNVTAEVVTESALLTQVADLTAANAALTAERDQAVTDKNNLQTRFDTYVAAVTAAAQADKDADNAAVAGQGVLNVTP